MTEHEDKDTRRAKRREQQKTSNADADGAPDGAATKALPSSDGPNAAASEVQAHEAELVPRVEQIRDRNARLRAQAAEERRAKRDKDKATVAVPIGLDASERMDDIFVRTTHAAGGWIRKNFRWLQWVVITAAFAGIGLQTYRYMVKKRAAASSDSLFVGLAAEGGNVKPASTNETKSAREEELEQLDPRPVFESEQARTSASEQGYRKAVATHGNSGAGWLARLGLAGVLFDQQKWDEALDLYRSVRSSELAKTDPDILGRSLEGIGLCLEGKGDLDGALQAFRELTNQEGSPSLATLGLYHQSRLTLAQGNKDKAKELVTKAKERLDKALDKEAKDNAGKDSDKSGPPARPSFMSESVKTLLARIDPNSAEPKSLADALRGDPDKIQRMLEGLKNKPAPEAPGGEQ